jgi:CheY-like chemotaxis protein
MSAQTILAIDDSPTILKLVELTLTKAGYRVVCAETGEGGIESAQTCKPDLILLDYMLPDVKGDDVCRALSTTVALAAVPVIVMSAKGEEIGECFSVMGNVANILPKPFSPDALLTVVGHALKQPAATAAKDAKPAAEEEGAVDLRTLLPEREAGHDGIAEALPFDAALAGDLAIISIADVLLLLQDRGYTGTLGLSHARARLEIFLSGGRVDFASARGVSEEFLLGRFLVSGGHISESVLTDVLEERQNAGTKDLLGAHLCTRGLLTPAGLRKAMAKQTSALVYESLRWGSGRFVFLPQVELSPMAREAALGLSVDGLIIEGLRRVEEWRVIEQEIGDFDMTFVRNEDKLQAFGRGHLLREEAAVVELVNGKNTVRDIVQISKMGSYDVTQVLFRLLRSKLIRRRVAPLVV